MSVKKPEEMSLDELKAKEKLLQLAMGLFGIILILITAVGIYMDVNIKGSVVFIILPAAFLPLLLGLSAQLKKIKMEIASRNT